MQGRSTASAASSSVAPCIWPDSPIPRTAPGRPGLGQRPQHRPRSLDPVRRVLFGPAVVRARLTRSTAHLLRPTDRLDARRSGSPSAPEVPRSRPMYIRRPDARGFLPRMIIARISSSVTSSTFTVPTSWPFFITAARSHSSITSCMSWLIRKMPMPLRLQLFDQVRDHLRLLRTQARPSARP